MMLAIRQRNGDTAEEGKTMDFEVLAEEARVWGPIAAPVDRVTALFLSEDKIGKRLLEATREFGTDIGGSSEPLTNALDSYLDSVQTFGAVFDLLHAAAGIILERFETCEE